MLKKPMDNLEGLSEDEIQEKLDKIREHEFTKKEERELILAAFKTFLPASLGVVLIFILILKLLLLWLS